MSEKPKKSHLLITDQRLVDGKIDNKPTSEKVAESPDIKSLAIKHLNKVSEFNFDSIKSASDVLEAVKKVLTGDQILKLLERYQVENSNYYNPDTNTVAVKRGESAESINAAIIKHLETLALIANTILPGPSGNLTIVAGSSTSSDFIDRWNILNSALRKAIPKIHADTNPEIRSMKKDIVEKKAALEAETIKNKKIKLSKEIEELEAEFNTRKDFFNNKTIELTKLKGMIEELLLNNVTNYTQQIKKLNVNDDSDYESYLPLVTKAWGFASTAADKADVEAAINSISALNKEQRGNLIALGGADKTEAVNETEDKTSEKTPTKAASSAKKSVEKKSALNDDAFDNFDEEDVPTPQAVNDASKSSAPLSQPGNQGQKVTQQKQSASVVTQALTEDFFDEDPDTSTPDSTPQTTDSETLPSEPENPTQFLEKITEEDRKAIAKGVESSIEELSKNETLWGNHTEDQKKSDLALQAEILVALVIVKLTDNKVDIKNQKLIQLRDEILESLKE